MQQSQQHVLERIVEWLDQGESVYLCTVAQSSGSSPRSPGAMFAICDPNRHVGSVSGGCVEQDLMEKVETYFPDTKFPILLSYGSVESTGERNLLPCGGQLQLLVERIEHPAPFRKLIEQLKHGQAMIRHICLNTGEISLKKGRGGEAVAFDGENLTQVLGSRQQMLIIGATDIARYLVPIALTVGFRVVVCDPRSEYLSQWDMPGTETTDKMPDDAVDEITKQGITAVIALSHDPRVDDIALMAALESGAFYVGALGSRRNSQQRRLRLGQLGLDESKIGKLHGPIGLPIGGRDPAEIAVSIIAEIIAERNKRKIILAVTEASRT